MNSGDYCMQLFSLDKSVRDDGAKKLSKMGEEGVKAVLPLLSAENWVLRYRAAEVIGCAGCKSYARNLVPLLSDKKDHVRYMAAKSLGMIGDSFYTDEVRALLSDENPYVVRAASRTLEGWRR